MRQFKITHVITTRNKTLSAYLAEIARYDLLPVDKEVEVARLSKLPGAKGRRALDTLVCANLRFVVSVAKQYQNQGMGLMDLINEGNLGLIRAAKKFDETRGFRFISYAVWWIRQSILQALAEKSGIVRLPLNQVSARQKLQKLINEFEQQHQRQPSYQELSEMVDQPPSKIEEIMRSSGRGLSVDTPLQEGETNTMADMMTDPTSPDTDAGLSNESLSIEMGRALAQLSERDREIVRLFYGIGCKEMSLEQIGHQFNLTRERVRQIKENALRSLRVHRSPQLQSYL